VYAEKPLKSRPKKFTMRKTILILFTLFTLPGFSQWEADLKKTISWYQITPTGNLILATNDGIVGINESNGQLLYTIPNVVSVLEEEFQVIPNTPFGMISRMEGRLESKLIFKLALYFSITKKCSNVPMHNQYLQISMEKL